MQFESQESPYPFVAMVPQDLTKKLLVETLRSKGGTVEYETCFVSAVQLSDFVTATLDRQGRALELTANSSLVAMARTVRFAISWICLSKAQNMKRSLFWPTFKRMRNF